MQEAEAGVRYASDAMAACYVIQMRALPADYRDDTVAVGWQADHFAGPVIRILPHAPRIHTVPQPLWYNGNLVTVGWQAGHFANTVVVFWPATATGFTLQTNTTLAIPNWGSLSATPDDDGTNKFIVVSPPAGDRFFRLSR